MDIQNLPIKPKVDKKNVLILFLIITNLFLLSFFFLKKPTVNQSSPDGLLSIPTDTSSPEPTTNPTIDPTQNWQTYKNEKYGFEFKYPSQLEFIAYSGDIHSDQGDGLQSNDFSTETLELGKKVVSGIKYLISANPNPCELLEADNPMINNIRKVVVGNQPAKMYHFSHDNTVHESVQIPLSNNCIYLGVSYGPNYLPLWENQYNQILSTFKFTN